MSNKSILEQKSIEHSPFLFHFSVEMKQKQHFQKKKTGERWKIVKPITLQINSLEITGNGVSCHYARNNDIKV